MFLINISVLLRLSAKELGLKKKKNLAIKAVLGRYEIDKVMFIFEN